MRVLVTGGSGYIGSHVVRALYAAGHDVVIYDNLSTGVRSLSDGFELIEGDIADVGKVSRCLKRVDAVMHFAASAYVGESVTNPRKYFGNNVEAGLRLLDAVLGSTVNFFVFSSTCATYGIPKQLPVAEDCSQEPVNPYGASKLFFEHALTAYAASHGLKSAILRYFNAAGADPSGAIGECHQPETHLIPLALQAVLGTSPPLTVFGRDLNTHDGTCVRDFIHVSDLASAHVQALEHLEQGGGSLRLNLGTGHGTSILEVLRAVKRVTGRDVPHRFAEPRAGDPPILFADVTKAKQVLGWSARIGVEEMVATAWRWEKSEKHLALIKSVASYANSSPASSI